MKKNLLVICLIAVCVLLCACGKTNEESKDDVVTLTIDNTVADRISVLSASWYIDGNAIGSTGVETADGVALEAREYTFHLTKDDVEMNAALDQLAVKVSITEGDGKTEEMAMLALPAQNGAYFIYELRYENGAYDLCESK